MANVAKVILIGNLTRDPQLTYTPNTNTAVCDFGMAMNHRGKPGPDGQAREEVCFIDIRAFGKQAELLNQYMKKGRPLYVEGRLTYDQWTGQDGQKKSRHRVLLENFQFLGERRDDGGGGGDGGDGGAARGGYQNRQQGGGNFRPAARPAGGAPPARAPQPSQSEPPPYDGPPDGPDGPPDEGPSGDPGNAGPQEDKIPF